MLRKSRPLVDFSVLFKKGEVIHRVVPMIERLHISWQRVGLALGLTQQYCKNMATGKEHMTNRNLQKFDILANHLEKYIASEKGKRN